MVVRENMSRKESLTKSKELLEMVQARVLGVVYNGQNIARCWLLLRKLRNKKRGTREMIDLHCHILQESMTGQKT